MNELTQVVRRQRTGDAEAQVASDTPHFLINCLNSVYQLTEAGQPEFTMKMVRGLSRHLRYMLNAEVMVPLRQELEMVENYVDLSSIRYPGCLELTTYFSKQFKRMVGVTPQEFRKRGL